MFWLWDRPQTRAWTLGVRALGTPPSGLSFFLLLSLAVVVCFSSSRQH